MSEKPKRRFCRLHLSTVVLVAISAGVLMLLNFERQPYGFASAPPDGYMLGWPLTFLVVMNEKTITAFNTIAFQNCLPPRFTTTPQIITSMLLTDVGLWFISLAALILVAEYRIRRREGRKP